MDKIGEKLLRVKKHKLNMTAVIVISFLTVILLGTLLLMLPISSAQRSFTDPLTASFTSVSATCVTGLVVVDTGSYWSFFGQIVILLMIQIGGLGFMTIAVLAALLFGKAVTPRDRMLVAMSYNLNSFDSVTELVRRIAFGTAFFEGIGALVLMTRFIPDFGARGIWMSIFTSVSAFCNAGFDVFGNNFASLAQYVNDPVVNFTLMMLVIFGGIGFLVWSDAVNFITKRKRLSVYSKMVLTMTAILLVGGTLLIAIFEWNNPGTIGNMTWYEKIMASAFHSVTLRTAGFANFDNGMLTGSSALVSIMLMIVGGASGSTAGGIKVVTAGVLVYTVMCVAVGKKDVFIFKRRLSKESFTKAVAVFTVQLILMVVGACIISAATPQLDLTKVLYETASAVNTVGITMGITTQLGVFSKIVIMFLMYFGRVGILTVTFAMSSSLTRSSGSGSMTYPEANILIG